MSFKEFSPRGGRFLKNKNNRVASSVPLTLLHSEWPKLNSFGILSAIGLKFIVYRVLAVPSAVGLNCLIIKKIVILIV